LHVNRNESEFYETLMYIGVGLVEAIPNMAIVYRLYSSNSANKSELPIPIDI